MGISFFPPAIWASSLTTYCLVVLPTMGQSYQFCPLLQPQGSLVRCCRIQRGLLNPPKRGITGVWVTLSSTLFFQVHYSVVSFCACDSLALRYLWEKDIFIIHDPPKSRDSWKALQGLLIMLPFILMRMPEWQVSSSAQHTHGWNMRCQDPAPEGSSSGGSSSGVIPGTEGKVWHN